MKNYPKFLKNMPEFYGLSFVDLGALMLMLYLSMMMKLSPLYSLLSCLIGISVSKIIKQKIDFVGWSLPRKKMVMVRAVSISKGGIR
jgi:hypothetical protein